MTNSNELAFNTKRFYTKAGQRIGAVVVSAVPSERFPGSHTYTIAFADIDRGITGLMTTMRLTADAVMNEYDYNRYQYAGYEYQDAVDRAREVAATAESLNL